MYLGYVCKGYARNALVIQSYLCELSLYVFVDLQAGYVSPGKVPTAGSIPPGYISVPSYVI